MAHVPAVTSGMDTGLSNAGPTSGPSVLDPGTSGSADAFYNNGSSLAPNSNWTDPYANLTHPAYYDLSYRIVGCLFVSAIFTVGIVGNVMVVIVVSRTRSMHTPTNCYLVSLAVADIILLVWAPLPTIWEFFIIIDQCIIGAVGCSLMVFFQYLGVNVSSLSITAFTVERYIAICHPMKAQTMCTVRRAKRIIAGLWIFGIVYCAPWLGLTKLVHKTFRDGTTIAHCTFKLERNNYRTIYMTDLVIFYIIPLLLTCTLYGLIARILFTTTITATPGKAVTTASNGCGKASGKNSKKGGSSSRVQVIKMLAIVVGMFAVLWMPYRVYVVYNSFASERFHDLWFLLFCRIMVYMNSAINPILYNAMSVKFRRAFKRLLYCGKHAEKGHYAHVTTVTHNVQTSPAINSRRGTAVTNVEMK